MILSYDIEKFDAFSVSQRIQEKRIEKKIKAIDMANALEINKDQYSRIEKAGVSVLLRNCFRYPNT